MALSKQFYAWMSLLCMWSAVKEVEKKSGWKRKGKKKVEKGKIEHTYWAPYVNIDLSHQYWISVAESQKFLLAKRPQRRGARRNYCFRRLVPILLLAFVISSVVHQAKCHTTVFAATKGTLKSKEKRSKNGVMWKPEVKSSAPTPAYVS